MSAALAVWRHRYDRAVLASIPLPSGFKAPPIVGQGWQKIAPADQWAKAGPDFRGNVGLLCGNGFTVVDCDGPSTERAAAAILAGLGIDAPRVRTPSGGAHLYLRSAPPDGFTWRRLAIGPGELRARRAYVVAPPSVVNNKRYAFEHGAPESIPAVKWGDLAPLLGKALPSDAPLLAELPVPLLRRDMPMKVEQMLWSLRGRPGYMGYPNEKSRSEIEAGVIVRLILLGFTLSDVAALFEQYRCGHYIECKDRDGYLTRTYSKVLTWLSTQGQRPEIAALYQEAQAWAWPGRAGEHDRAVFLALLSCCWVGGSFTTFAPLRDIGLLSSKGVHGAHNALERLAQADMIQRAGSSEQGATVWQVLVANGNSSHSVYSIGGTVEADGRQQAEWVGTKTNTAPTNELWAQLGRVTGSVYARLTTAEVVTAAALAVMLGHHRSTVGRALRRLESLGLARQSDDGGGWVVGDAPLADALLAFDCRGRHARRVEAVESQRAAWAVCKRRMRPTLVGAAAAA